MSQCASCALLWGPADDSKLRSRDRRVARVDERRVHDAADAKGRRHPNPKGHHGRRRHAPDVAMRSATVATGALYMFRASKQCTGAHTPCMATGDTICAHA